MKWCIAIFAAVTLLSCSKTLQVELPEYDSQPVVEMYLEDGATLKCLLTKSIAYTSSTITKSADSATVIFFDGERADTLRPAELYDYEIGRKYNYASSRIISIDPGRMYKLSITGPNFKAISAVTRMQQKFVAIDSIAFVETLESKGSYKVGFSIADPGGINNYYRVMIASKMNDYTMENTDFFLSDVAFDGKKYSFSSENLYMRGDTVTMRLYSLQKDHYDYLVSTKTSRAANVNPFMQPVQVQSNITGGLGIFTVVLYDERKIIIR